LVTVGRVEVEVVRVSAKMMLPKQKMQASIRVIPSFILIDYLLQKLSGA